MGKVNFKSEYKIDQEPKFLVFILDFKCWSVQWGLKNDYWICDVKDSMRA